MASDPGEHDGPPSAGPPENGDDTIESLIVEAADAVDRGAWSHAIGAATRILDLSPDDPEAWLLLGLARAGTGDVPGARDALEKAVRFDAGNPQAWAALAQIRGACGDPGGASDAALRAWRCEPDDLTLARRAASALAGCGRLDDAVAPAERLAATGEVAHRLRLAELLVSIDRGEEAEKVIAETAETQRQSGASADLDVAVDLALRRAETCLPMVPASPGTAADAVRRFDAALAAVPASNSLSPSPKASDPTVPVLSRSDSAGPPWPFRLPALAEPDLDRARRHGALARRAAVAHLGDVSEQHPKLSRTRLPRSGSARSDSAGRIRVGLLSGLWRDHVVARLLLDGWTRHLDRSRFEVVAIDVGRSLDEYGRVLQARCDATLYAAALGDSSPAIAAAIAEQAFDALLLPEVGMAPFVPQLACLRLAPLQAVAWGHPETTGLSTIDLFLSSEAMEPANGDRHYTERLVRLPGLGAAVSRPPIPAAAERSTLGWSEDAIVCWCAQTPHKHAPRFDALYARIAASVPTSRFVFTTPMPQVARRRFEERLQRAFAAAGADPTGQLEFMEVLPTAAFRARLAAADVFLDPPGWSGGHTTLEAVAAGVPVITLPGAFMRRRHASGILRTMDPDDAWTGPLIAASEEDYVARAVALASDAGLRARLSAATAAHAERLFDDPTPIRALETVLAAAVASG